MKEIKLKDKNGEIFDINSLAISTEISSMWRLYQRIMHFVTTWKINTQINS